MLLLYHQLEDKHLTLLCVACDKQFANSSHLRRHIRSMHLQEKFICLQCQDQRIFTRKDSCRDHQLKVHGCVQCDICGGGFTSLKLLKEHVFSQHKTWNRLTYNYEVIWCLFGTIFVRWLKKHKHLVDFECNMLCS